MPKRMLKPCANISILPAVRFGAIASLYSAAAAVSGTSTMMTSAHFDASAGVMTLEPFLVRRGARTAAGRQADGHGDALSRRFSAWACPCDP